MQIDKMKKPRNMNNGQPFGKRFASFCIENINIFVLVALIIVGALSTDRFLIGSNLMNILGRITITSFCAFGFTFVYLTGDLTSLLVPLYPYVP